MLERCDDLATISASEEHLERVHLSPQHAEANRLVAGWMREAGLSTWQDAAGNQCGRLEGKRAGLPALLLGSHLDTVVDAGRFDGMLGVLLAIAVARRIRESGRALPFALEVIGFTDEEGARFGNALLGSRALAGSWSDDWWELRDRSGLTLREAFIDFGLDPGRIGSAARRPSQFVGYLEAHIEQGPSLEQADRALAVVSSIAGARRFALSVLGVAGHAGGTPYELRRDALVGASEIVVEIERRAKESGTIATVGQLQAYPGGINIIPGRVDLTLDLRAEFDADRDRVWGEIRRFAEQVCLRRGLTFEATELYRADAVVCSPRLQSAVAAGIRSTGDTEPLTLWSKAGHDAMAVSTITEFGMLFLRCGNGGISHHPDESVELVDVALALDALEAAVRAVGA